MTIFKIDQRLVESIMTNLIEKGCNLSLEDVATIYSIVKDEILYQYVDHLITQAETILDINPSLPEREILETLAKTVVEYLEAEAATIRIYDPAKKEMTSFGSYPNTTEDREEAIPFEDTIAGEVVKTRQSYFVPNILKEEKYRNKDNARKLGICSMLAVPVSLPRFSLKDLDTEGVLQIYFKEEDKTFTPLEVRIAEMLSRRVSYVVARKRILDLHTLNVTKNKIAEEIFQKLGRREGVKIKDVFNIIVPELANIMQVQRCSLFSVGEDRQRENLEAGYPERQHGVGQVFSVEEPYLDAIVNQPGPFGEFENETVYPTYILIDSPRESRLLPPDLKRFLENQQIHSVLYVPLKVNEAVNYFLAFDAQASHRRFRDEDIEVFTFFGKELMKGLRLEKMDDILHDFKNPAIAVSGFVRRVQKFLQDGDYLHNKDKIAQALDIVLKEALRIQELALTLHGEGREETVDLT
ncbi:MAG: GAF domain-containing protein, partial [Deltaproteobacteria bacterium]